MYVNVSKMCLLIFTVESSFTFLDLDAMTRNQHRVEHSYTLLLQSVSEWTASTLSHP